MKLRRHLLFTLLAVFFAASASAQAPEEPRECADSMKKVTLREGERVVAPAEHDEKFVFYNFEAKENVDFPAQFTQSMQGKERVVILSAQALAEADRLKESSLKAPNKFKLRWMGGQGDLGCLQSFDVVFVRPQRVVLDETGVSGRFVNPVEPVPNEGRPLEFFNNTGNRTFVVTIPFVYSAAEMSTAYAVADYERGRQTVSDIVCKVLAYEKEPAEAVKDEECRRVEIDKFEGLRVLLEAVSVAKPASLENECAATGAVANPKNGGCMAEILFWTSMCEAEPQDLENFAQFSASEEIIRRRVKDEAPGFLTRLFGGGSLFTERCSFERANHLQRDVVETLSPGSLATSDKKFDEEGQRGASDGKEPVVPFSYQVKSAGLTTRFADARIEIAKRALVAAIRQRMGFPRLDEPCEKEKEMGLRRPDEPCEKEEEMGFSRPDEPGEEEKPMMSALRRLGIGDEPDLGETFPEEIWPIFGRLDDLRAKLEAEQKAAGKKREAFVRCKIREVEAAGKLLASYSPDSAVPYSGIPVTLKDNKLEESKNIECTDLQLAEEATDKDLERVRQAERMIEGQRLNEQGIEITNCTSAGSETTCSATATIPPYQQATFSQSILEHHPGPRIRFTVSFFGDTEIPSNANGYVNRRDATAADEKPKSTFGVQFGGDSSMALDPDEAITGQLRHSSATGALSFQYTGPVEASANLRFKTGDLGGPSSGLEATQYQAKVYGPKRLVLQYGKIQFAQPSSGVAINVFGEGAQVIAGPVSLGYLTLRESEEGTANRENKDSDLWLLQVRSVPFSPTLRFLRTFDVTATYGEDRSDSPTLSPVPRPYTYLSAGGEVRWGIRRFPSLGGSIAAYHSIRDVGPATQPADPMTPLANTIDGRGTVGLLRVGWTHFLVPKLTDPKPEVRPAYGVSAFFGYGRGDRRSTLTEDEGYLGESASYTNDMIFLSKIANSKEGFAKEIGRGLSNKKYFGLQFTNSRFSPLAWITQIVDAEKDINSRSTVVTLHGYRFNRPVRGEREAGEEVDVAFNVEVPKNVQWVLSGAYYRTPDVVGQIIGMEETRDLWSVTAKLSIKLASF